MCVGLYSVVALAVTKAINGVCHWSLPSGEIHGKHPDGGRETAVVDILNDHTPFRALAASMTSAAPLVMTTQSPLLYSPQWQHNDICYTSSQRQHYVYYT